MLHHFRSGSDYAAIGHFPPVISISHIANHCPAPRPPAGCQRITHIRALPPQFNHLRDDATAPGFSMEISALLTTSSDSSQQRD